MSRYITDHTDKSPSVSPGSIGGKIRKFRELRGLSQKELGIQSGFSESTADVRIAQYEKNRKIPRENALKDISEALGVSESALLCTDLLDYKQMYQAMFDMEDFHGLHPVRISGRYYLEFSGATLLDPEGVTRQDYDSFLDDWYNARQKYQIKSNDSEIDKKNKSTEYSLWRGAYPVNVINETDEEKRDKIRINRLQAELDALNAKLKNNEELARINDALNAVPEKDTSKHVSMKKESDFIMLILDLMKNGILINRFSPGSSTESASGQIHLLSVKEEDILRDDEKKPLYVKLTRAIESIRQCGIGISRRITSQNNVFYLTYSYPAAQRRYFENLDRHWEELALLASDNAGSFDHAAPKAEERFIASITGDNDISFVGAVKQ